MRHIYWSAKPLLCSKRKDIEMGLGYNHYRYYEPYSARYIEKDQIEFGGGFNGFAYADINHLNF